MKHEISGESCCNVWAFGLHVDDAREREVVGRVARLSQESNSKAGQGVARTTRERDKQAKASSCIQLLGCGVRCRLCRAGDLRCLGSQEAFGTLRTRLCGLHSGYTENQVGRALDRASKQSQSVVARSNARAASGRPVAEDSQARKKREQLVQAAAARTSTTQQRCAMDTARAQSTKTMRYRGSGRVHGCDKLRGRAGEEWVLRFAVRVRRRGRSEAGAFLKRP